MRYYSNKRERVLEIGNINFNVIEPQQKKKREFKKLEIFKLERVQTILFLIWNNGRPLQQIFLTQVGLNTKPENQTKVKDEKKKNACLSVNEEAGLYCVLPGILDYFSILTRRAKSSGSKKETPEVLWLGTVLGF